MITLYQKEFYRNQSIEFIKDIKRRIDKHLCVNKANVYHVQAYLRKLYKENRWINLSMSYGEFVEEVLNDFSMRPEFLDIIYSEIDYKLNTLINPKIFFYD